MKRLNITHGKAYFDDGIGNELEVVVDHRRLADFFDDSEESEANATLYADAHNSYHATGMLPSEMAERIKALEDAGDQMLQAIYDTLYSGKEVDEYPEVSEAIMPKANAWYKMRIEQTKPPINEAHASIITKPE